MAIFFYDDCGQVGPTMYDRQLKWTLFLLVQLVSSYYLLS